MTFSSETHNSEETLQKTLLLDTTCHKQTLNVSLKLVFTLNTHTQTYTGQEETVHIVFYNKV